MRRITPFLLALGFALVFVGFAYAQTWQGMDLAKGQAFRVTCEAGIDLLYLDSTTIEGHCGKGGTIPPMGIFPLSPLALPEVVEPATGGGTVYIPIVSTGGNQ